MGSNPTSSESNFSFYNLTMFFHLKASAKDKRVLEKFSNFLNQLDTSTFVLKHRSKQNQRKFITILKSPHVNKTAQEQFEYRFYYKQFLINSLNPLTFFLLLKKAQNSSFSGLKLEIKSVLNSTEKNINSQKILNPDNFLLNQQSISDLSLVQKYIQLFDCHGETFLKRIAYSSK